MAARNRRPPRGAIVWGVIKWAPFLALPLSVFFLEVRWQHEIFANDYETNQLSKELRELERKIAEHEDEEARLKTMELMETMAMELDLVEPQPRQVETIFGAANGSGAAHPASFVEWPADQILADEIAASEAESAYENAVP